MIDVLSHGRLEAGFVRGVPYEILPANSNPVRMNERQWEGAVEILSRIAKACLELGLVTAFHHHAGTDRIRPASCRAVQAASLRSPGIRSPRQRMSVERTKGASLITAWLSS